MVFASGCASASPSAPADQGYAKGVFQTTKGGRVQGIIENDGKTLSWLGLPYAEPPVGERRWRAPRKAKSWDGVRPAAKEPTPAVQMGHGKTIGSEDCLYLSVFRPNTAERGLPVLLFIHGGNNQSGSTNSNRGHILAEKANCVVVTINYRLGALGFLCLPALKDGDPLDDSGNFALLDMNAALDWVIDNIDAFGGDPKNITVGGHSAGARDVMAILLSPLFKGKFQRAFASSGGMTTANQTESTLIAAKVFAKLVVADGLKQTEDDALIWLLSDGADVKDYLYRLPAERIAPLMAGAQIRMASFPHLFADGAVLPRESFEAIKSGAFNDVPVLLSATVSEFSQFALHDPYFWPSAANGDLLKDTEAAAAFQFAQRYGNLLYGASNAQFSAQRLVPYCRSPVYTLLFAWGSNPEVVGTDWARLRGARHGIDQDFLFGMPSGDLRQACPDAVRTAGYADLGAKYQKYVANFIRTGNPNGEGLPKWEPWSALGRGPTDLVLDADKDKALVRARYARIDRGVIFAEMENDKKLSEAAKKEVLSKVLLGRFFSAELDRYFAPVIR